LQARDLAGDALLLRRERDYRIVARKPHAAFQTLLGLSTVHQPSTYREIIDELPRAA